MTRKVAFNDNRVFYFVVSADSSANFKTTLVSSEEEAKQLVESYTAKGYFSYWTTDHDDEKIVLSTPMTSRRKVSF